MGKDGQIPHRRHRANARRFSLCAHTPRTDGPADTGERLAVGAVLRDGHMILAGVEASCAMWVSVCATDRVSERASRCERSVVRHQRSSYLIKEVVHLVNRIKEGAVRVVLRACRPLQDATKQLIIRHELWMGLPNGV